MKKILFTLTLLLSAQVFAAVQHVSDGDFKDSIRQGVVVVDFFTDWCGPCKSFAPVFEAVSGQFEGKALFAKYNGTKQNKMMDEYNVTAIPTIVLFKNGKEIKRNVGPMNKDSFILWVQKELQK